MEELKEALKFLKKQPQNIQIKKKSQLHLWKGSQCQWSVQFVFDEKLLILNTVSSCSTSWDGKQENPSCVTASNTDKDAADGGHQARELIQKLQAAGEGRTEGHYTPKITTKHKRKYTSN